jgi:hypothetical protein
MLILNRLKENFKGLERPKLVLYIVVYFLWGFGMNLFGEYAEIAKFTYWWQVITCYILYMVPVSILLRDFSFFTQYCYGLFAMGLLELAGYALETSYVYPENILIQFFGEYTFALIMTLFFALYFPLGNLLIDYLYDIIFENGKKD